MDYNTFKNAVIAQAKAMGIADYELYYQSGASTSASAFQHEVNDFTSSVEGGVCFRCIANGKMGYASTENLCEEEARAIVARAYDNALVLEAEEAVFLAEGGQEYEPLPDTGYELPSTEEMLAAMLDAQDKLYEADPHVIDGCQTEVLREAGEVAIYNSKGLDLHHAHKIAGLISVAVVSDGQEMANDFQFKLGALNTIDVDKLAKKAAAEAVRKLGGDVPKTQVCPVVFNPDAMASLLSTYSSIFSSEAAQKGLSQLAGKEGQVIASPVVTIVDDPFYKDSPAPMNFDAEGSPTHRKNVVEAGVLNTLLYNLKTAAVAGKKTTGNAAKGGYAAAVGLSPFTMYIAPGENSEEELLAKAGNGVYITSLDGLHAGADPISGDFSLQSAGYLIEDGKKTDYVKSFTVAGNFYELLKKITAVASNVELPSAFGSTAFGSPSVLVETLSIAGK